MQIVTDPAAIVLALRNAVKPGETVTVSYTKPGSNPLKDAADNETASFTDLSVANNLAAAAPDAPRNLAATASSIVGEMMLSWDTPWHNGNPIDKYEVRFAKGTFVPAATTWTEIEDSDASTTSEFVTNLDPGAEYAFEVRAVNGIGNGGEGGGQADDAGADLGVHADRFGRQRGHAAPSRAAIRPRPRCRSPTT